MSIEKADRSQHIRQLIECWRGDADATYHSWFPWDERIKNFRSIRRGVQQVVAKIEVGTFGVTYRGSSLETVVHSIPEQRQIFKGANQAFLWKPKLRIPDIYANPAKNAPSGAYFTIAYAATAQTRGGSAGGVYGRHS